MKLGLCKYKHEGCAEVTKKVLQLHNREAFGPLKVEDMTEWQKKDALEMLMFLKENRHGAIKARICADGRKQRDKYNNAYVT